MDRSDHPGTERDVVDEVAVHDVEVQPVTAALDGAGTFVRDAAEVGGEHRGGNDPVVVRWWIHRAI